MPTQSWRGKSAVIRIYCPLTFNGYSNSINAIKRQRNLGLVNNYTTDGDAVDIGRNFYILATAVILNGVQAVGHNFERNTPKDYPFQAWFNLVQWFQRRRYKCESLQCTTDDKIWQKITWTLAGEL